MAFSRVATYRVVGACIFWILDEQPKSGIAVGLHCPQACAIAVHLAYAAGTSFRPMTIVALGLIVGSTMPAGIVSRKREGGSPREWQRKIFPTRNGCSLLAAENMAVKTDTSRRVAKELEPYVQLQQQMHEALRRQHPEWVLPNDESPMCDAYESRLAELLGVPCPSEQRVAA